MKCDSDCVRKGEPDPDCAEHGIKAVRRAIKVFPGDDMTPEEQFNLGAVRGNIWIQRRAMDRGFVIGKYRFRKDKHD